MVSVLFAFALILTVWLISRWRSRSFYKLGNKVPTNPWHEFFGFGYILNSANFIPKTYERLKKHGPTSTFWVGPYHTYVTTDPEIVKDFFTSKNCVDKPFEIYKGLEEAVIPGLISDREPYWSKHRRIVNKAFSNKNVLSFLPTFNVEIDKLVNELKPGAETGEPVDVLVKLRILTMRSSTRTTLKRNLDLTKISATSMSKQLEYILHLTIYCCINPIGNNSFLRTLIKPHMYDKAKEGLKVFFKFFDESLKIVRNNDIADESFLSNEFGVIDCCIDTNEQKNLDEDEIRGLLIHFYLASFETISTTLYIALLLLSMYPEYQDRAYEEVLNILNDGDTELTVAQLDEMVYLDMIFNETMRVLPIVPIVFRKLNNEELKLSNNVTLPVGQIVGVDIFHLHRSKEIWGPDAESFNPDHFLPSNAAGRHPYSFVPFTKGQRFCIGWRYATLLFKMCMAKLLKTYKFSTDFQFKDIRYENHISLKLVEEPPLKVEWRNVKN